MDREHQTSDVFAIRIEPLAAGNRAGVAALFARLSPESRRRRFLTPKPELADRELAFLTAVDHVRHEAVAAVDQCDGSIVGIARYVQYGDRTGSADVAIEVADQMQRIGIGTALMERLVERARVNGLDQLTATTLWENRPARALLRSAGFQARSSSGSEIDLELELGPAAERALSEGQGARS
jgi:GNAT superfamily N-acetyltransferase